ncbi:phosphatidate cytidylyltransferase [Candidatus Omnitrophus magneticus]|uniref:Phosphatidate cytidylyltransferase n=1 Tax=Candidatus Omnitrophus magneticus TaxID=1609969 RepID=A0A0F0CQT2_9BACT|nr:phosphatidate cytidylyltransferase [Candidatus Omnitrophus magneticus]
MVIYVFPLWLFTLVVTGFVAVALIEFFRMTENRGIVAARHVGTFIGSLFPPILYLGMIYPAVKQYEFFLAVLVFFFVFIIQFTRNGNNADHLVEMGVFLFSIFYISVMMSFFLKIRFLANGANLVAFIIIVTKGADIGAYLGGRKFGRHDLFPRISPNKTWEGFFCGILMSIILSLALGRMLTGFSMAHIALLSCFFAVIGQFGDLAESLIKRNCKVKDSGAYFAEIGGILDLVDSLLFSAPIFYFYLQIINM